MSYSRLIKEELATINSNDCCLKTELYSIIKFKSNFKISSNGLSLEIISTLNAFVRRVITLFKKVYNIDLEIKKISNSKLDYKDRFIIEVTKNVFPILYDLKILNLDNTINEQLNYEILKKDCCKASLFRGLFLVQGSITDPSINNYHLEIVLNQDDYQDVFTQILNEINITPKFIHRSKGFVMYLKKAEYISDFLKFIKVSKNIYHFEDLRIKRDFNNSINRVINCDIANEEKAIKSAKKQLENIECLIKKYKYKEFSQRIKDAIKLRKLYPDASLSELSTLSFDVIGRHLSKSGLSHCYKDIEKMCEED